MNETLQILSKMDWPAAFAIFAICGGSAIALTIRRVNQHNLERAKLHFEEHKVSSRATVEVARINASKANGSVPAVRERDDY